MYKSYGHEVPLVMRQRMPTTIQNILEARKVELRRLQDKTSPKKASSTHEKGIHHTKNSAQNAKTSERNDRSQGSMRE